MLRLLLAISTSGFVLLACAARCQETEPPHPLVIRPILTSEDPAGDDTVTCYVLPLTHKNGYRDSPEAVPGACIVEITDTLTIEQPFDFDEVSGATQPKLVVDVLEGPENEVIDLPKRTITEFPLSVGTKLGAYRFRGHLGTQQIAGGFTVRRSSKRVLQLVGKKEVVLAGYQPLRIVPVDLYTQISFRADRGSGERKWRYVRTIKHVSINPRGEADFKLSSVVRAGDPTHNFLLATDPRQQNDLFSAYSVDGP